VDRNVGAAYRRAIMFECRHRLMDKRAAFAVGGKGASKGKVVAAKDRTFLRSANTVRRLSRVYPTLQQFEDFVADATRLRLTQAEPNDLI
jgi:hypothetical protein